MPHRLSVLALAVAAPLLLALPAAVGAQTRDDPVLIAEVEAAGTAVVSPR